MPNYRVVFREEVTATFDIRDCRTPEEAEGIAEGLREDGVLPDIEGVDYLSTEVEEIEEEG